MNYKHIKGLSIFLALIMILGGLFVGIPSKVWAEEETFVETFDNLDNKSTSYGTGSFIGVNNITWNYVWGRGALIDSVGDYSIDGKGLMFRRPSDNPSITAIIGGGIKDFSLDTKKAFTGTGRREIELLINDESKSTFILDNNISGVQKFKIDNINIEGEFKLEIKHIGSESGAQTTIDNITWTSYGGSTEPPSKVSQVIATPMAGEVEENTQVILSSSTEGTTIYYTTDGNDPTIDSAVYSEAIIITEAITIKAMAVREGMDNSDVSIFDFTISAPMIEPTDDDLFISEYIEGSSNNKAIEIYNGTGNTVNLSEYKVELYANGAKTPNNTQILSGTLANGDVYVIANSSADQKILNKANITSTVTYFNGDDALVLKHNDVIIDVFGQVGFDPGTAWGTGDDTTVEHTLVRKAHITKGDTNPDDSFDPTIEWDIYPQDTFSFLGYHTIGEDSDTILPIIIHIPVTEGNKNEDLTIKAIVTDDKKVQSVKLYYKTRVAETYIIRDMTISVDGYSYTIPRSELSEEGIVYYIEASDGINTSTSPDDTNTPYEIKISSDDILPPNVTNLIPASGSSTGANLRPLISAEYSDESDINLESIKLYLDEIDVTKDATITASKLNYIPATDLPEGNHTVKLIISDKAKTPQTAVVEWNFYVGERVYNFYFGQIHSHTNLSDGQGTLTEAYTWARDNGKADFFAVTDHSNSFDNDLVNENITDVSESTCGKWKDLNRIADTFNKDGEFVAIAGFEMTWSGSTGGWGHINTFNTPWFVSRNNKSMSLESYYSHISADTNSISQLNHPGNTFGDFADFGYYSEAVDNVVHLIEVGNGEGPIRGTGYYPSYEYYARALDKGWHVAPSNNQDNHKAKWVTANEARTIALAPELTRESIFDAIRNLRVYASEDRNLEIMYTVNGNIMGTVLNEPDKLEITIDLYDPDEDDIIGKVSIIGNGGVIVSSKTFNDNKALWELELDPQYSYYYVRVDQGDKDIAVTAPVWTSEIIPVGISKVEVSQDPQIKNKPIDISATVYNNGATKLSNVKVEFYKDSLEGTIIGENTIDSISSGKTGTASIEWTANDIGKYNIYAKAIINVDGVDKIFTGSTSVTYSNSEDVIKVVLDRGHYNAYISGDYANKDMTLRQIFRDRKYMLVENNDELTKEDLEDAQLLIITDPQSTDNSSYNLLKSKFSQAEIAAIQEFTDNGGSLIICSKADYKDGIGEYSNGAQLNPILESVGANLRVNDDQVVDAVSNGGQSYRLYFDRYVSSKYNLTDNIPVGTTYSFYSGCSVILKDGADRDNVDWLVMGHETTGTDDADKHGDNIPVEQGNVYAIGAEVLPSGAKIIVAGTIFFSDFETESGDNMYSNKQITENILDWIIEPEEIELKTIREVRIDANNDNIPDLIGQKFTIEGRITSESVAHSDANGRNNAFFDVIYVQDETGGITVFGVSETLLPLGTKVKVTGVVDVYDGDTELSLENELKDVVVIDDEIVLIEPLGLSTRDSMLEQNEGFLVKVKGTVTRMTENSLYIDDGSGEARIYVNGYIGDGTNNLDMLGRWDPSIKVGDIVSATGLASEDPEGHRLRVRNTAEIVKEEEWQEPLYPIEVLVIKATDINGNEDYVFNKGEIIIVKTKLMSVSRNEHSGVIVIELLDDNGKVYGISMICEDSIEPNGLKEYTLAFEMTGQKKGNHTARVYVLDNLINRNVISEYSSDIFKVEFGNIKK